MGKKKKTILYEYKDKDGNEKVAFIDPKKARKVEGFKKYVEKRAKRNGITLTSEEENEKH